MRAGYEVIETDEAATVRAKPTDQELERAIASVPGVEEAHVTQLPDTGKSRLRIRLANGEDAPTVSWAIAATLRERFGIVLDPGAIRPRLSTESAPAAAPAAPSAPTPATEPASPVTPHASAGPAGDVKRQTFPDDVGTMDHIDLGDESVVVIGDRILLSEAARAVLSEAIDPAEAATTELPQPERGRGRDSGGQGSAGQDSSGRDSGGQDRGAPDDVHPPDGQGRRPTDEPIARAATTIGSQDTEPVRPLSVVPPAETRQGDTARDGDAADQAASTPPAERADAGPALEGPALEGPALEGPVLEGSGRRRSWRVDEPAPAGRSSIDDERGRPRAAIHHLDTHIDVSDVRVTATLRHRGRSATGEARSVPTRAGILRAVAEATVSALRELTGDRLIVGVDSVTASVAGDPPMATVLVGVVTEAGEDTLVGAALVRQDPERAVMRATLDALNRRVEPWLEFDLAG